VANKVVESPLGRQIDVWAKELSGDIDADFILAGITSGFNILDENVDIKPAFGKNYKSATAIETCEAVEAQILEEIDCGNYVPCETKPTLVSSLGAIPKPNGKVRLIHDCSRPGGGLNSYATTTPFAYQTVDEAIKLLLPGGYMAKVDLRHAYRVVPIKPCCYEATGLHWLFKDSDTPVYFYDTKLPFGASKSPEIFNKLSKSVVRMMKRRGFVVISYMDDFLVISQTKAQCYNGFNELKSLLLNLGFQINYEKVVAPCQKLTFLGIEIDSKLRTLSLPQEKLDKLRIELCRWLTKKKATKRELQQLTGKLNWAAHVIYGGRTFLRRLIDLSNTLKRSSHHTRLSACARADIRWWQQFCSTFNGTTKFVEANPVPLHEFSTDACNIGGAASYQSDWVYCSWKMDFPEVDNEHINFKELFMVYVASKRWCKDWSNKHIVVYTDNSSAMSFINKGSCRNAMAMSWLRDLFWMSAVYNFRISARFIPGKLNIAADSLSRIHVLSCFVNSLKFIPSSFAKCTFCQARYRTVNCSPHMSKDSFLYLQDQWRSSGVFSGQSCRISRDLDMPTQQSVPTHRCAPRISGSAYISAAPPSRLTV